MKTALDLFMRREGDWRDDAACANVGGDLWFPEANGGTPERAKKICNTCPVMSQCLQAGMDEEHGIWGGLSVQQRKTLKRSTA